MKRLLLGGFAALALCGLATLPAPAAGADGKDTDDTIHLFNGKDLTNFYTYLKGSGKNEDPKKVFTVKDGRIRVSGEVYGGLITAKEYENYHLVVEFAWGSQTFPP